MHMSSTSGERVEYELKQKAFAVFGRVTFPHEHEDRFRVVPGVFLLVSGHSDGR